MEELTKQLSLFNWADHSQSYNIIYWALTDHVDNSYTNKEEYKKEIQEINNALSVVRKGLGV
jgi:hypothetical protein|tara:strand:- start:367 stop:552 length:186 start_codon:yes stop_codon:yes gene_type:complete